MSVSIGWRPNNPKKINYVDGGSSFHKAMENAFGGFPTTLDEDSISVLRGIASCGFDGAEDLISAILDNDSIIVDAEW